MYQQLAWLVSFILTAALLAVFVWVVLRSRRRKEYAAVQQRAYRIRAIFFWALLLLVMPVMVYSMTDLPYDAPRKKTDSLQIINAVGHQWYWTLSDNRVPLGQPVEFWVTSADVNHGFGIYDHGMRLLAQTNAMPGYTNKLRFTFPEEGTYRILCMEYCGVAHHNMVAEIHVTPKAQPGEQP